MDIGLQATAKVDKTTAVADMALALGVCNYSPYKNIATDFHGLTKD